MTTPTPIIEALEPCPFCGKQPVRNGRGAVGGVLCGFDGTHRVQAYGATQAAADATWNTRPSLKSPPIDLDPNGGASGIDREAIARLIDPAWWEWFDRHGDAETIDKDLRNRRYRLEAADRILAALTPTGPARSDTLADPT